MAQEETAEPIHDQEDDLPEGYMTCWQLAHSYSLTTEEVMAALPAGAVQAFPAKGRRLLAVHVSQVGAILDAARSRKSSEPPATEPPHRG